MSSYSMNGSTEFVDDQDPRPRVQASTSLPMFPLRYGIIQAVPVVDIAGSSGWLAEKLYRVLEIVITLIGLIAGLPLMALIALIVRSDSPGPALFWHTRPGRSIMVRGRQLEGRPELRPPAGGYDPDRLYYVPSYFSLVKFRTMYSDARSRFPVLYNYDFGPQEFHRRYGTLRNDPRVTRIGGFLRKLSVDELPNL